MADIKAASLWRRVDHHLERLGPGTRLALELLMHAAVFVMLGYLIWFNVPILQLTASTRMLATDWPDAIRHLPLTIVCVLLALYQLRHALEQTATISSLNPDGTRTQRIAGYRRHIRDRLLDENLRTAETMQA